MTLEWSTRFWTSRVGHSLALVAAILQPSLARASERIFVQPTPPPTFDAWSVMSAASAGVDAVNGETLPFGRFFNSVGGSRQIPTVEAAIAYSAGLHVWRSIPAQDVHNLYAVARPPGNIGAVLGLRASIVDARLENSAGVQWRTRTSSIQPWASAELFTLGGSDPLEGKLQ